MIHPNRSQYLLALSQLHRGTASSSISPAYSHRHTPASECIACLTLAPIVVDRANKLPLQVVNVALLVQQELLLLVLDLNSLQSPSRQVLRIRYVNRVFLVLVLFFLLFLKLPLSQCSQHLLLPKVHIYIWRTHALPLGLKVIHGV